MTPTPPPYRLDKAPGKNLGLFATRRITPGELVISEAPLFTAQNLFQAASAVEKLDKDGQDTFFALTDAHCPAKPTPVTIFKTNALPLGVGSTRGGLFPLISRINHSCQPNVHHSWNASKSREVVYATSYIAEGAEILTTYLESYASTADRKQHLAANFRFECRCEVCEKAGPADDDKRVKIAQLSDSILHQSRVAPTQGLRLAKERLRLMEEIGFTDQAEYAVTNYDAYQACVAVSDLEAAKRQMGLTYQTRLMLLVPCISRVDPFA